MNRSISLACAAWVCAVAASPDTLGAQLLDGRGRLADTSLDSGSRQSGTDLRTEGGSEDDSPDRRFVIVGKGAAAPGRETPRYSDLEYSQILRSIMRLGSIPLAITHKPGQTVLPENFERDLVRNPGRIVKPITVKAIDLTDRGAMILSTREQIRLRGARVPSQFSGTEASRGAGRDSMGLLRDMIRAGDITIIPGFPVRDSAGAILVDIPLEDGRTLTEFLISEGLAMTEPADFDTLSAAKLQKLTRMQNSARRNRLGLWGRR